jgi:hypothetical protein
MTKGSESKAALMLLLLRGAAFSSECLICRQLMLRVASSDVTLDIFRKKYSNRRDTFMNTLNGSLSRAFS